MIGKILQNIISDDQDLIVYRPALRTITKSISSALLLSQMMYWDKKMKGEFFKFKAPCNHPKYKEGDSWCEELNLSPREFDTALKNIGCKFSNKILKDQKALIWYHTDINRITYYTLNNTYLRKCLKVIYANEEKSFSTTIQRIHTENTKRIINNSNDSEESHKKGKDVANQDVAQKKRKKRKKLKKNIFAAKLKKRKLNQQKIQQAKNITPPKPKYKHTIKDLRNYNELLAYGITDHRSEKPRNKSIDALHALFSKQCKDPYHMIYTPEFYDDFTWDMDSLIEVFEYHLKHAAKFNIKPTKAIGSFIFSEGYNGAKSWSPLIYWHLRMTKTAKGQLTENGKNFLMSLKRAKVHDAMNLDSTIINKVAKETYHVATNHVFMDGKTITMSYPCGIIDTLSGYIKEQTNREDFKLVYITKNGFVDEFLDVAMKRNIIKPKLNGRSVFTNV